MVLNKILFAIFILAYGSTNITACLDELKKVALNVKGAFSSNPNDYAKMFSYSGKSYNQLGRFEDCYSLSSAKYVVIEFNKRPPVIMTACGPDICDADDYYEILNSYINSTNPQSELSNLFDLGSSSANVKGVEFKVIFPEHYVHSRFHSLSGSAITMIFFVTLIGVICIAGTAVDLLVKHEEEVTRLDVEQTGVSKDDYLSVPTGENTWINIMICFSITRNMRKLMSVHLDDYHPHLYFFDGIRVITMGWVVLGTIGGYYLNQVPLANYMWLHDISKKYYVLPAYASLYALDSLLWVGGFLYAYFLLNSFSSSPKHWMLTYFKHYLEMMPLFIFVTLFFWSLSKYIGAGPFWYTGNDIYHDCSSYWWANGIFLNNFIPNGTWSECISPGWFLAVEMQLFIFTPPLVWLYKKSPMFGWILIFIIAALGVILGGVIAHHFDLNVAIAGPNSWDYFNYYNNKPYIRMVPYVLGLSAGFVYYTSVTNNEDSISNLVIRLLKNFWVRFANLALGITLWLVVLNSQFATYEHPGDHNEYDYWTKGQNAAYLAFARLLIGISYSLMFTPMVLGYFSYITAVLGSSFWTPWSRLTFTMYLVHVPIIDIFMRSLQYPKYFNKTDLFVEFLVFTLVSYFFSVLFAVFIDIPVKTFILMVFGKKNSKEDYFEIND